MVTVVTRVRIKDGREAEWDEVFGERARAARGQDGFHFVQLCCPEGAPSERVIVGTWDTRENWQAWHRDDAFLETRRQLEEIDEEDEGSQWWKVVVEERATSSSSPGGGGGTPRPIEQ
jgi:heme-degrading monooxygenase HmoA